MKKIEDLLDKMYDGVKKLSFEEFLQLLHLHGELEFYYNRKGYGVLRLNDDFSKGKDKIWNRSKDYYAIYELDNVERGCMFNNIKEFAEHAKVENKLLKTIWNNVEGLTELCPTQYHGFPGTHEHTWTENGERGPAVTPTDEF